MLGKTSRILNMQKTCPKGLCALKQVEEGLQALKHVWNVLGRTYVLWNMPKIKMTSWF